MVQRGGRSVITLQSIMKINDKYEGNLEKMIEIQREMIAVYQGEYSEDIE